ncbi:uncharacterized protein UTRI_03632_B [Ustilago trichophora]|uniref:Uncharacterized protein n=1 Tax=Ustilago trichophora TaxID=86804 RepID=A0A5C3E2L0_9BASI|nr:uncharacterized protein UTRI_03632_B [Ustilago trichophora]
MSMKKLLLLMLSLATIATGGARGFEIDKDIIICTENTPVEQAIEALKEHVVEAIRQNPSLKSPHVEAFPQFFEDMRMSGRMAQPHPIEGLAWNTWYAGELGRMHAEHQAYLRTLREIHTEAARMQLNPRRG